MTTMMNTDTAKEKNKSIMTAIPQKYLMDVVHVGAHIRVVVTAVRCSTTN